MVRSSNPEMGIFSSSESGFSIVVETTVRFMVSHIVAWGLCFLPKHNYEGLCLSSGYWGWLPCLPSTGSFGGQLGGLTAIGSFLLCLIDYIDYTCFYTSKFFKTRKKEVYTFHNTNMLNASELQCSLQNHWINSGNTSKSMHTIGTNFDVNQISCDIGKSAPVAL